MLLKCSTSFWLSGAWSPTGGSVTGDFAKNIIQQKTDNYVSNRTNTAGLCILNGNSFLSRTRFNNGSITMSSVVCSSGDSIEICPVTSNPIGIEIMFFAGASRNSNSETIPFNDNVGTYTLFSIKCYDSRVSAVKAFCLCLTDTANLALVRTDNYGSNTNPSTQTPTGTNPVGFAELGSNKESEVRVRAYRIGTNIYIRASVRSLTSSTYGIVSWVIPSNANGFLDTGVGFRFDLPTITGGPYTTLSDLTVYEVEQTDIDNGYAASAAFHHMPRCLPFARKTTDVEEYRPDDPGAYPWSDAVTGLLASDYTTITDGNDATGQSMDGTGRVGFKTKLSPLQIAAANGYSCSRVMVASNMVVRLSDDDGEPISSEIGRTGGGTPQTQIFSGMQGSNSVYCHNLIAAALLTAAISKTSNDITMTWRQDV